MSKFRAVKGILPKKAEIVDWSSEKICALLQFASISLREREYRGKKEFTFNWDKKFEDDVAMNDNTHFIEFMTRLKGDPDMNHLGLRGRLTSMVRTVLSYVKSNPHIVTDDMEILLKSSDRFNWALNNFETKKTAIGAEVVSVNNEETTQVDRKNSQQLQTNLTMPEVQFNQSMLMMTSLMKDMLASIKKKDLKNLDAKDKLKLAIPMLAAVAKAVSSKKPGALTFKKIVINSASKDDLEKAILDYNQTQE